MPEAFSELKERWERSSTIRPLASGATWSVASSLTNKGAVLLLTVAVSRSIGLTGLGLFTAAQAAVLLATTVWDAGLSAMGVRDIAVGILTPEEFIQTALKLRILLFPIWSATTALLVWPMIHKAGLSPSTLFFIFGAGVFNSAGNVANALLTADLNFSKPAVALMSSRLLLAAFGLAMQLFATRAAKLDFLFAGLLLSEFLMTLIMIWPWLRRIVQEKGTEQFRAQVSWKRAFNLQKRSFPYFANGALNTVYNRLDVLLVSLISGAAVAGAYTPASRVQDAMMLFPSVAATALIPLMSKKIKVGLKNSGADRAFRFSLTASLIVTIPATAVAIALAGWLVPTFLGESFAVAVQPTRVLLLSLPFIAVSYNIVGKLQAEGNVKLTTIMYTVGAVVALYGIAIFTPKYGSIGAAFASFIREPIIMIVGFLCLYYSSNKMKRVRIV